MLMDAVIAGVSGYGGRVMVDSLAVCNAGI